MTTDQDNAPGGGRGARKVGVTTKGLLLLVLILCCVVPATFFFSRYAGLSGGRDAAEAPARLEEGASSQGSVPATGGDPGATASGRAAGDSASNESLWRRALGWIGLLDAPGTSGRPGSAGGTTAGRTGQHPGDRDRGSEAFDDSSDRGQSISGKVLDEAGAAVAGIELSTRAIRVFQDRGETGASRQDVLTATDGSGFYRFEQLEEGEYRIRTAATDRYRSAETVVRTGVDSANLVVAEERPLAIYGTVTGSRREPLPEVLVVPVGQSSRAVSTDREGNYRLQIPVGGFGRVYTLKYVLAGYREEAVSLNDSQIRGQNQVRQDVPLKRILSWAAVTGKVSDSEGTPLGGETVYLLGPDRYQAVTSEAGEFVMPEVEAETTYRLWVHPRGPYRQYAKQVWVGAEGLKPNVVVHREPPESYGRLSGRMVDAGGQPVPNFSLWLEHSSSLAPRPQGVTADQAGRFSLDQVPEGRVSFKTLSSPQLVVSGIQVSSGEDQSVDLPLDWGVHEVHGRVLDARGNPVPAPRVVLTWSHQGQGVRSHSVRQTSADASGSFRFTRVGPGVHLVSIAAPGFQSARIDHTVGGYGGDLVVQLEEISD